MSAVLEVTNIKKSFGGITAVDGVSFDVREGEILGLIGPNGCGKSTLFNCILGIVDRYLNERRTKAASALRAAAKAGLETAS